MFVIFDLDGTLCDISHRLHFIKREKPDWDAFNAACVGDKPKWPVIASARAMMCFHTVEIWSGRSDEVWNETRQWLNGHTLQDIPLTRMRAKGDYTPDHVLKQQWLFDLKVRPDLVFDDRQRVVDMWRANNIICAQVAAWEEHK